MMLAVDHKIDAKERTWFLTVMNSFGVRFRQRAVLRDHLMNRSTESLETVFARINSEDQKRLLNFLKVAMNVDGEVSPSEKEFFDRVMDLNNKLSISTDYTELGRSLLKHENETRLWKSLGELGVILSKRRHGLRRFHIAADDFDFGGWSLIYESIIAERPKASFIVLCIFLLSIVGIFWLCN